MTPLERIHERLHAVGARGGGNSWCCPAHPDSNPSLSVSEGEGGRVLLKCHAGCSTEDVLSALDLKMSDLFAPEPEPHRTARQVESKVVATYDYLDQDGELRFQVLRLDPKSFRQRRPAPDGGWIHGMSAGTYEQGANGDWYRPRSGKARTGALREFPGVDRILFRALEVAKAVAEERPVLFLEGEKDVLAADRLGLVATTIPGGAKATWSPVYTESLRGAEVRVIPDRDQAGEGHARRVFAKLTGKAKSVSIRRLPAEDGIKDLSDLVERRQSEGRSPEEIRTEIEGLAEDEVMEMVTVSEGPLPLHRELPDEDPYPIEALPNLLRGAIGAIVALIQVPVSLAAQSVLAVAAHAAQGVADIVIPATGQVRPVSLYLLTIADSGDRKTSTDAEASLALATREAELREKYVEKWPAYNNAHEAWKSARAYAIKAGKGSKDRIREALENVGPEPEPPPTPILRVSEPTWEGLVRLFTEGQPSLALFSSEGGEFIGGHAMNADNRLKSATGLSKLWDGQPISRTRGGEGAHILPGRRLSAHLAVQPLVADGFLGDPLLWSQGLLSRFLVTSPRSLAGQRFWREGADVNRHPIEDFASGALEILRRELPLRRGPDGRIRRNEGLSLPAVPFSHASVSILRDFHNATEKRVRHEGELEVVKSLANKGLEHACRIAGVVALIGGDTPREIPLAATEAGIYLAQYYFGESLRLREAAAINPDLHLARRLFEWMRIQATSVVTLRRILQYGPRSLRDRGTALRILRILEDHRYIEGLGATEVDGVRAKLAWRVLVEVGP